MYSKTVTRSPFSSRRVLSAVGVAIVSAALVATTASAGQAASFHPVSVIHADAADTGPTLVGATAPTGPGVTLDAAVAAQNTKYDGLNMFRFFYSGLPAHWSKITQAVGTTPVLVSFDIAPAEILSGADDTALQNWFATAPTGYRTFWNYFHEPEDNITAGQFTMADYRAAYNHVLDIEAAYGSSTNLRATMILMCWTDAPASGLDWHNYYPGDRIQVMAWDCYNAGDKKGRYRDPAKLLAGVFATSAQTGIPFGLAEIGTQVQAGDDGSGRAAWLSQIVSLVESNNGRFVSYFDSNVGTDYRLNDAPSITAWTTAAN
jgi:hypothetical protein